MDDIKTARGFAFTVFKDFYGEDCSIQKSSLATEDCIWLGIQDAKPKIMASKAPMLGVETKETTGWVTYPIPDDVNLNTRMHLSRDQVAELLPYLKSFVETGEI